MPAAGPGGGDVPGGGRAAVTLADRAPGGSLPWEEFTASPHEDLADPGRVHIHPFGHVRLCQGPTTGNLFETSLAELVRNDDPTAHPIVGPLLEGRRAEPAPDEVYGVGEPR